MVENGVTDDRIWEDGIPVLWGTIGGEDGGIFSQPLIGQSVEQF